MHDIHTILSADGPFAQLIPGFAPRLQQQELAMAVAEALEHHQVFIAEAGTGTGKTFAYLVPALLSGQKVIISTGTKNLQDQLFHKDLPLVRQALGVPVEVALLKGRANYLCLHRMELALAEGRFRSRREVSDLQLIREWSGRTRSGDIAELTELAEDAPLWPQVTSTADNCLGSECGQYEDCYLMQARRRAQEADVLVVNHHLLFADMALKGEGFGELLPGADACILDEAHQLPETAANFFGTTVSGTQLLDLAGDSIAEDLREAGESGRLRSAAEHLQKTVKDLRLAFGVEQRRGAWSEVAQLAGFQPALNEVATALEELHAQLKPLAARGKGLESCLRRCEEMMLRYGQVSGDTPPDQIHWFETHTRSFSLNLTPMDVAALFQAQVSARRCAWIFTSATLAVGDSFAHFTHRLGLHEAKAQRWDSPFDFARQALLYVPPDMPDPNAYGYTAAVIEQALPVLEASRGRAFILFTSHRALQEAAGLLEGRIEYPLLVQGQMPRSRLLEQFRALGNAVLLGTGSFWEGVDVRGEALSCVIIDKLPFASPGDPVLQARIEAMREQGGNPFMEYQLPQAVITLKQGVGRLIRDINDRGVLMLCDPRLGSKSYGRVFIDSLPPMSKTRKLEVVQRFFAQGD
ncbi:MAG: ATP-dependent DNA helicase [Thiohalomonadaceae bacterium]